MFPSAPTGAGRAQTLCHRRRLASADVICQACPGAFPGAYLGAYWPGDRGTFRTSPITTAPDVDEAFVLDVNANGTLAIAAAGRLTDFRVELYSDAGSICGAVTCSQVVVGELLAFDTDPRRLAIRGGAVAGRYVLRITGRKPADGSGYTGSVAVRKATPGDGR